ncbi:MAG: DUF4199 domain-containing protein [Saprospiraceae bacterium]
MKKYSIAIKFGLIWGIASIIYNLSMYLINGKLDSNWFVGMLIFAAGISVMYFIGIKRREEIGGFISWKEAMTHIWVGALISTVLSTLFTVILYNFIAPELLEQMKEMQIEMIEKLSGTIGQSAADAQIEKIQQTNPFGLVNSTLILAGGILVQFVLSCLVALAIKNVDTNEFLNNKSEISDRF